MRPVSVCLSLCLSIPCLFPRLTVVSSSLAGTSQRNKHARSLSLRLLRLLALVFPPASHEYVAFTCVFRFSSPSTDVLRFFSSHPPEYDASPLATRDNKEPDTLSRTQPNTYPLTSALLAACSLIAVTSCSMCGRKSPMCGFCTPSSDSST